MTRRRLRALAVVALVISTVSTLGQMVPASADDASYTAAVLGDGAIAYWRLGDPVGSSVAADASGQNRVGTYSGAVQLGVPGAAAGATDTAASFDGGTGLVTVADDSATRLNGSFTIEFWANQNSFANTWPGVLGKGTGAVGAGYLIYAKPNGALSFKRNNTETVSAAGALVTGAWHHYAVTYDGTTLRWFVDGVANASAARAFPVNADTSNLLLGQADHPGNNRLDEVALYPTALTGAKLLNHVQLGAKPPVPPYQAAVLADTPIAYWKLGEAANVNTAADASGANRAGAYTAPVQRGVPSAVATQTDTAASFTGGNARVNVPDDAALRLNGNFSIEFWANQNSFINTWPGLLGKGIGNGAGGYLIYAKANGALSFKRNNTETVTTANALRTGQWHHYAVTYDGATLRWYVDGVANTSVARVFPANNTTAQLTLGRADEAGNNRLDEVALYAKALTAAQVANHVSKATPPPPPPPPPAQVYANTVTTDGATAYWRLGEASGATTAADASGHNISGTYTSVQTGVAGALAGSSDTAGSFDGVTSELAIADTPAIRNNGAFSVEFWANRNAAVSGFPGVMAKGDAATKNGFLIYSTPDGRLSYKRDGEESPSGPNVLVTGQWHHYVVTYDGAQVRWFVDGVLSSQTPHFFELSSVGTAPLRIGRGDTNGGNNRYDEIAMYGTALTPSQIANHYAVGHGSATTVAPGVATGVKAVPGNASAGVQWTKPANDGGTKITSYRVTASPGGATFTVPGWATSAQPSGLTNGVAYTFTVAAISPAGTGLESAPSAAITPSAATPPALLDSTPGDWAMYTHDIQGSGNATAETTLTVANAPTVHEKWKFFNNAAVWAQPAAGFGGVFVADNNGYLHKMSPTGTELWKTFIGRDPGTCAPQGPASSATLATLGSQRLVYVGGGDAQLYAIDADSGAIVWRNAMGENANGAFAWSSPFLYNNAIYMGYASNADCPLVRGSMMKIDPATGRKLAETFTAPDGCLGGGIWGSPTFADGMIYATTGTQDPCSSPVPLEISMVAFDADTLAVTSSWHIPEQDQAPDGDFGSVPTVFDAAIPGTSGKFVGAANKNGVFYVFDRMNVAAGPVWQRQIAINGGCPYCGDGSIAPAAYDGTYLYTIGGTTTALDGTTTCKTALRALRPTDGSIVWEDCRTGVDDGPDLGPVTIANGVAIYCEGHFIVGVNAATGARLFSYRNAKPDSFALFYGGPAISNGVIYAGDAGGSLYAITPT